MRLPDAVNTFHTVSNAYGKASLVKVVVIFFLNAVSGLNFAYKVESGPNDPWVTAQDFLAIELPSYPRLEFRFAFDKPEAYYGLTGFVPRAARS
jgi:hypothetical protein